MVDHTTKVHKILRQSNYSTNKKNVENNGNSSFVNKDNDYCTHND